MIKKQILITGGGTGIRRALAKRFAAKGLQVIIVGRCSELLQDVVSQYPESIRAVKAIVFHNHYKNSLRLVFIRHSPHFKTAGLPVGVTILNLNHLYFLERVLKKDQYD